MQCIYVFDYKHIQNTLSLELRKCMTAVLATSNSQNTKTAYTLMPLFTYIYKTIRKYVHHQTLKIYSMFTTEYQHCSVY